MNYTQIKEAIKGPVYAIPPAFKEDQSFDAEAVKKYTTYLASKGAKIFMTTAGTGSFNLLEEEELLGFNEVVAGVAKEVKGISMVGNQMFGSVDKAITYAKHAERVGATAILLYYPERFYDEEQIKNYYETVANNTTIPLLAHAMPMRNAKGGEAKAYDSSLLEKLREIPSFIGLKEESGDATIRNEIGEKHSENLAIIVAGDSMNMYLESQKHGIQSYLVGVGNINPEIEEKFYTLVCNNHLTEAKEIIENYEKPFFEVLKPIGWHLAIREAIHQINLLPKYQRKPFHEANAEEKEKISQILTKLKLQVN